MVTINVMTNRFNGHQSVPHVSLTSLDTLWFQVAGTICNLRCNHCFISCTPENDKFKFLSLETCKQYLQEAADLGVKEFYFTGGEPFANPQMCDILEETVKFGPATILTNATLFRESTLKRLRDINASTPYSIEMRVSIDGYSAEMNDPIRGPGTFYAAIKGVEQLVNIGYLPIITITRTWNGDDNDVLSEFRTKLIDMGYKRPRFKILPSLKLGAEIARTRGYHDDECVTHEMMADYDASQLVCSSARVVTDQGIWVCPILLDAPDANLGHKLSDSLTDYPLRHNACYTCWTYGAICSNVSSAATATTDA